MAGKPQAVSHAIKPVFVENTAIADLSQQLMALADVAKKHNLNQWNSSISSQTDQKDTHGIHLPDKGPVKKGQAQVVAP